jgi:Putative peptidoglycan binding domain
MLVAGKTAIHGKDHDMLPSFKNLTIAAIAATTIATTTAVPADAFGRNERHFVQGAATALIIGAIIHDARRQPVQQQVYVEEPRRVYVQPEPVYVQREVRSSIYHTPAAQAFNSYSRSERLAIQRRLAGYGYYRSGIDGAFGPGTYAAVTAYARDTGIEGNLASSRTAYGVYDALIY